MPPRALAAVLVASLAAAACDNQEYGLAKLDDSTIATQADPVAAPGSDDCPREQAASVPTVDAIGRWAVHVEIDGYDGAYVSTQSRTTFACTYALICERTSSSELAELCTKFAGPGGVTLRLSASSVPARALT